MKLDEFDYTLPEELIAQNPSEKRDECRLMVLDREKGSIEHGFFYEIKKQLIPGDCLVLNDSRVIPARLFGIKEKTGARIELLLVKRISGDKWETMVRPGKRVKTGDIIVFGTGKKFRARITGYLDQDNGTRAAEFDYDGVFMERLEELGSMPLPPYIKRKATDFDKETYQTVYSKIDGSVAAPTAGLHFTRELLEEISDMGVQIAYVTLHVGIGTFRPVKVTDIENHKMHFEEYSISEKDAKIINNTIQAGGRIISVGTTSARTLESAAEKCSVKLPCSDNKSFVSPRSGSGECDAESLFSNGDDSIKYTSEVNFKRTLSDDDNRSYIVKAGSGSTDIFIYPGYNFKIVDALITNFHLPKSTLIMMVSALYDKDKILEAYQEAVEKKYRFFSYGDAMMIK